MNITSPNQSVVEVTVAVTAEQFLNAASIATEMYAAHLPAGFVASALLLARQHRGVYELMVMWQAEQDRDERAAAVADLQDLLDDAEGAHGHPTLKPRIGFREAGEVAAKNVAAKAKLRALIDKHGGISTVARQAGIPQPSLSRMLNSASMPRRVTIYKIAAALGLDETEIATDFMW